MESTITKPGLPPVHPDAAGFSAFRLLPGGDGRQYTAVEFVHGRTGAARFLHRLRVLDYVRPAGTVPGRYAVLDVLDATGGVVQDYDIPHVRAWGYIKRKLRLAVQPTEEG